MGNWQLEVGKMALYMMFPVLTFHYFNQPQLYEEWVSTLKKEIYPPESDVVNQQIREKLREIRQKRELEELKKLQAKYQ